MRRADRREARRQNCPALPEAIFSPLEHIAPADRSLMPRAHLVRPLSGGGNSPREFPRRQLERESWRNHFRKRSASGDNPSRSILEASTAARLGQQSWPALKSEHVLARYFLDRRSAPSEGETMHADERASASLLMQIKRSDERSPQVRRRSDARRRDYSGNGGSSSPASSRSSGE